MLKNIKNYVKKHKILSVVSFVIGLYASILTIFDHHIDPQDLKKTSSNIKLSVNKTKLPVSTTLRGSKKRKPSKNCDIKITSSYYDVSNNLLSINVKSESDNLSYDSLYFSARNSSLSTDTCVSGVIKVLPTGFNYIKTDCILNDKSVRSFLSYRDKNGFFCKKENEIIFK